MAICRLIHFTILTLKKDRNLSKNAIFLRLWWRASEQTLLVLKGVMWLIWLETKIWSLIWVHYFQTESWYCTLVLFTIWPQTWNSMIVEYLFRVCESVFKRETPLFSAMWNKSTAHCCQTIDKLPRISSFFTPLRGFLLPLQGTHTTGYPGRNY